MKQNRYLLLVLAVVISCARFPKSEKEIVGKYLSYDDERGFKDYVVFYDNRTYIHFRTAGRDTLAKAYGVWKFLNEKGSLYLGKWTNFSLTDSRHIEIEHSLISVSNDELIFSADNYKRNFKKI